MTVALDSDLAGTAPIYRGRLQPVGQIGSLVRIPQGPVDLIATVTLVGIAELAGPIAPTQEVQRDKRWLQVQLLGEIERGSGAFERGISSYPGLDDPVHFATPEELQALFPPPDAKNLLVGHLAADGGVPVCVDASRFVVRHAAIVGSTGSGKTSAVASLLQGFVRGGWSAANIVVVDPHGEYASALGQDASVKSVLTTGSDRLRVPFWALTASDIARIFCPGAGTSFLNRYTELVANARRNFVEECSWLSLDPTAVTADTPVPFDLRSVWHQLDYENNVTLEVKGDPETACVVSHGNARKLVSTSFKSYGAGSKPPHKGPSYSLFGTTPEQLRLSLLDPQLRFLLEPEGQLDGTDPLVPVVQDWLGGSQPVSVLDFSGVPAEAAELAIGVVLNLVFEVALRSKFESTGVGRPSPVLVVLEEAHRYLSTSASALTRESANRIAREGRKYGVGLLLVTQRPAELPSTALAQCGTIAALRLSNSEDQGTIRAALPDSVSGLAAALPSLRTGEGLVSGESIALPVRVLFDRPDPRPLADDPSLLPWRREPQIPDVAPALIEWRGVYEEKK